MMPIFNGVPPAVGSAAAAGTKAVPSAAVRDAAMLRNSRRSGLVAAIFALLGQIQRLALGKYSGSQLAAPIVAPTAGCFKLGIGP
jgi:hypothetical protein